MTFRNNTEAENLRLRNELREAQEKLARLEAKAKEDEEIKESLPKPPGWFATKLAEYRNAKTKKIEDGWKLDLDKREPFSRSATRRGKRKKFFNSHRRSMVGLDTWSIGVRLLVFLFFTLFACKVYRYCTDITEGTVVGHEFVPEHEVCSRDNDGFEHCSDYGPYYILTIQEGTETAEWHVSQGDYDFYHDGDHYCYEDWFRGDCN